MKKNCILVFLSFFVLLACVEKEKHKMLLINMPYIEARKIIINEGWKPTTAERDNLDAKYQRPRFYYDMGFTEVSACSGTGMGYCLFEFENRKGEILRVITTGGDFTPEDKFPPVVISLGLENIKIN